MSNPEPYIQRAARRHRPAILGILVALALAALALFFFAPHDGTPGAPGGAAPAAAPAAASVTAPATAPATTAPAATSATHG